MDPETFYIVDVFAESKYSGNQLAIVTNAGSLSDEQMQRIAKEMNYSETTFILSDKERNGGYDVRIFTPAAEVPFAGHPTLGTAFIIRQEIIGKPVEQRRHIAGKEIFPVFRPCRCLSCYRRYKQRKVKPGGACGGRAAWYTVQYCRSPRYLQFYPAVHRQTGRFNYCDLDFRKKPSVCKKNSKRS